MIRIFDERAAVSSAFSEIQIGDFFVNPVDDDLLVKISNESGISFYDRQIEHFTDYWEVLKVDVDIYIRRVVDPSK